MSKPKPKIELVEEPEKLTDIELAHLNALQQAEIAALERVGRAQQELAEAAGAKRGFAQYLQKLHKLSDDDSIDDQTGVITRR